MKAQKREIKASDLKGYAPEPGRTVTLEIPSKQDMEIFKAMQNGMPVEEAMKKAGLNLPAASAERYAKKVQAKYNDRMRAAYDDIGLTPEFIAGTHKDIITEGKDSDRLKAIDQVMQIQGGYAPKQVEVNNVTFEQAVVQIGQIVNVNELKAADVRKLFQDEHVVDAEIEGAPSR